MLCVGADGLRAQVTTPVNSQIMTMAVRGRVQVISAASAGKKRQQAIPATVVWLTPVSPEGEDATSTMPNSSPSPPANLRLVQKDKSFQPHILVVPAGSMVEFPNHDPFFHNVFSLFEGKRFDLGLYEAGTSRMVRFDRPGISYIFCNIHPEMNAVIITMATPLFAISNSDGQLTLPSVPYGRYKLHVWSEGMDPETAPAVERDITVTGSAVSLGIIRVPPANGQAMAHTNKYGREYDDPTPNNSVYEQQR